MKLSILVIIMLATLKLTAAETLIEPGELPFPIQPLIGGELAELGEFPSVVWIEYGCTGSLIAKNKILIAAHCVIREKGFYSHEKGQQIRIYSAPVAVGSQSTDAVVKNVIVHPHWLKKIDSGVLMEDFIGLRDSADLAVLILEQDFKSVYKTEIAKISFKPLKIKQEILIGGYGCEVDGEPNRDPKYKHATKLIQSLKGNLISVNEKDARGKKTSMGCEGDSGGPVFIVENGVRYVIGVNSSLQIKGQKGILNMISLAKFKSWLSEILVQN